jgi:hypothetical protein
MLKKNSGRGLAMILAVIILLTAVYVTLFSLEVGMSSDIGIQYPVLPPCDYSLVPQPVIDNAVEAATVIVGKSREKLQEVVDQLLATYLEAKNRDVVVVFNSGGWGWNIAHNTSGWGSILDGIESELESQGYQTAVMNYRRTGSGFKGILREFVEAATRYPHKAKDLAARIEFLTANLPELKVIIAGESTGTVISDKTMGLLKNDTRVYSIQTGTPFWHKTAAFDRTLLMNNNGATRDTFSYGDVPAMVWTTVKSWFGVATPEDKAGHVMFWLKAPGHDYSWQYPGVYNKIVEFIKANFNKDE